MKEINITQRCLNALKEEGDALRAQRRTLADLKEALPTPDTAPADLSLLFGNDYTPATAEEEQAQRIKSAREQTEATCRRIAQLYIDREAPGDGEYCEVKRDCLLLLSHEQHQQATDAERAVAACESQLKTACNNNEDLSLKQQALRYAEEALGQIISRYL